MQRIRIARGLVGLGLLLTATAPLSGAGITFGQLDDFQSGTAGWQQGFHSPNPTSVVATGGPTGAGDPYLKNVATGSFGPGGKQVMFNNAQWTGDFVAAGVTRLTAELANFGTTPLAMRVWVTGGTLGGQFGSTNAVALPPDGQWHAVTFDLSAAGMTAVSTSDTLAHVMAQVNGFRILSAAAAPGERGDQLASTLGVDDIRATIIAGDTNHDNTVNFTDLLTLAQHYGQSSAHWEDGDFNFDGAVNFNDLLALAQNYGTSVSFGPATAAIAAVPEPAVALPLIAIASLLLRRHRAFGDLHRVEQGLSH